MGQISDNCCTRFFETVKRGGKNNLRHYRIRSSQPTNRLVVRGIKCSERWAKGTRHLLIHDVMVIISLQHRCSREGRSVITWSVMYSQIKRVRPIPPYMMVPLLLKTTRHWSRAGAVCSRWKVLRSHWNLQLRSTTTVNPTTIKH